MKTENKEYHVGDKIKLSKNDHLEIMAEAKGYFMARRKGCFPFVVAVKDFQKTVCNLKQP